MAPRDATVMDDFGTLLQEIVSLLRRRRYPEMLQKELKKKKLRTSSLGVKFHIQDLVGLGHLKIITTSAGALLRVSDTAPAV